MKVFAVLSHPSIDQMYAIQIPFYYFKLRLYWKIEIISKKLAVLHISSQICKVKQGNYFDSKKCTIRIEILTHLQMQL